MDRSRIETHVKPLIGRRSVRNLTIHDLEEMQADIASGASAKVSATWKQSAKDGRRRGGVPAGGSGVAARSLGMLGSIFEHAVRKGVIAANPARGTRKLTGQRRTTRLGLAQIGHLGQSMRQLAVAGENPTGLAVIRFILLSGFRRQEALAIERCRLLEAGGVDLVDTKSGAQVRPLGRAAASVLLAQSEVGGGRWIFPADRGEGHFVGVRKVLDRVCRRAELEGQPPRHLQTEPFCRPGRVASAGGLNALRPAPFAGPFRFV